MIAIGLGEKTRALLLGPCHVLGVVGLLVGNAPVLAQPNGHETESYQRCSSGCILVVEHVAKLPLVWVGGEVGRNRRLRCARQTIKPLRDWTGAARGSMGRTGSACSGDLLVAALKG